MEKSGITQEAVYKQSGNFALEFSVSADSSKAGYKFGASGDINQYFFHLKKGKILDGQGNFISSYRKNQTKKLEIFSDSFSVNYWVDNKLKSSYDIVGDSSFDKVFYEISDGSVLNSESKLLGLNPSLSVSELEPNQGQVFSGHIINNSEQQVKINEVSLPLGEGFSVLSWVSEISGNDSGIYTASGTEDTFDTKVNLTINTDGGTFIYPISPVNGFTGALGSSSVSTDNFFLTSSGTPSATIFTNNYNRPFYVQEVSLNYISGNREVIVPTQATGELTGVFSGSFTGVAIDPSDRVLSGVYMGNIIGVTPKGVSGQEFVLVPSGISTNFTGSGAFFETGFVNYSQIIGISEGQKKFEDIWNLTTGIITTGDTLENFKQSGWFDSGKFINPNSGVVEVGRSGGKLNIIVDYLNTFTDIENDIVDLKIIGDKDSYLIRLQGNV